VLRSIVLSFVAVSLMATGADAKVKKISLTKSNLPVCEIWYSGGTNGDYQEKFIHEQAHCWGWTHPEKGVTGQSFVPPAEYRKPYPNLIVHKVDYNTEAGREALDQHCDGHYGCQFGGVL
jgi:hypothetical protein